MPSVIAELESESRASGNFVLVSHPRNRMIQSRDLLDVLH